MRNYSDDQNELIIVSEKLHTLIKEVEWISQIDVLERLEEIQRELIDYIDKFDNK